MASSSMCGPSNPLQQLKNHTSFDRSLQQERFRPSTGLQPSSQFRHQPLANQSLDHEFEQFLGNPTQTLHSQRSLPNFAPPPPQQQQSWATDFQRLQLSTPPPPPQQVQRPISRGNVGMNFGGGWGAEFLQQLNKPTAISGSQNVQQHQQQQGFLSNSGFMMNGMGHMNPYSPQLQTTQPVQDQGMNGNVNANYTDAEFDKMFEEAAVDQEFEQKEEVVMDQLSSNTQAQEGLIEKPLLHEQMMESFQPEEREQDHEEKDKDKDNADELARTAGQLLDTLSHDTSQKFQESQFLALMRKLRDKTVKVEDGKMVEV